MSLFQPEKRALTVGLSLAAAVVLALTYMFMSGAHKEPDDFRGIKWGSFIGSLTDMKLLAEDGTLKFYERPNEQKTFGDVKVDQIVYGFYKDRFYNVMTYFSSPEDFDRIQEVLSKTFGPPAQGNEAEKKRFWNGEKVSVLLSFDDSTKTGRMACLFKPIQLEIDVGG